MAELDLTAEQRARQASSDRDAVLLQASWTDPEAFGEFYDRHIESVLRFFYRRTASAHTAADLSAETFAQAYVSRRRFQPEKGSARAWLFGIARHQHSRLLRRRKIDDRARRRLGMPPLAMDDQSTEMIERMVDFEPVRRRLREVLSTMSPALSDAVLLRVVLELPYSEIAVRLECSEAAARTRVTRGLAELQARLEDADE